MKYCDEKWIGKRYGLLEVIGFEHHISNNGNKQWYWKVKCFCGKEKIVKPLEVIKGRTISCGCKRKEPVNKTHGDSHTRLHDIWCGINNRCNPSHKHAERYGKRGISICKEWGNYENFKEWALSSGYEDGLTIERKDVNSGYSPENCEWIPLGKQARNRRTTFWVTYQGEKMSLAEAAEIAGLPYKQVHYRIKRNGWSVEKALSIPIRGKSTLRMKCEELGLNYHTIYNRIWMGWSEKDAINTPIVGLGANQTTYK